VVLSSVGARCSCRVGAEYALTLGGDGMAVDRSGSTGRKEIEKLTKNEIDRRIERLIDEVAGLPEEWERSAEANQPRWIAPSELVRRLRQFIVYN
jgi:hypothetical protein